MSGEFLVESSNLLQPVNGANSKGHILELVVSSGFCPENVDLIDVFVSDQNPLNLLLFKLHLISCSHVFSC